MGAIREETGHRAITRGNGAWPKFGQGKRVQILRAVSLQFPLHMPLSSFCGDERVLCSLPHESMPSASAQLPVSDRI